MLSTYQKDTYEWYLAFWYLEMPIVENTIETDDQVVDLLLGLHDDYATEPTLCGRALSALVFAGLPTHRFGGSINRQRYFLTKKRMSRQHKLRLRQQVRLQKQVLLEKKQEK